MATEQTLIDTMRDELELLGSLIRAERANPTTGPRECTDEQLERVYVLRDKIAALRAIPTPESAEPVAWMWLSGDSRWPHHITTDKSIAEEECSDPAKIIPLYTHPPKPEQPRVELTDEFVKARAMEIYPPDEVNDGHPWYGHRRAIEDSAARHMVRHLHKLGYVAPAPFTVDEVMELYKESMQRHSMESATMFFQDAITAKFGKP